jgi:nucleotide-binding universal stress UspA family protein
MKPQRILTPIDFSEMSRMALGEADKLAIQGEGSLTLLHVHRVVQAVFLDATYYQPAEQLVPEINQLEEQLNAWARDLRTPKERIETKVVLGVPVQEIVTETENHDLVVIATHGRTGLSHFLMGSVAERVVRASRCSVLVIKDRKKPNPKKRPASN